MELESILERDDIPLVVKEIFRKEIAKYKSSLKELNKQIENLSQKNTSLMESEKELKLLKNYFKGAGWDY